NIKIELPEFGGKPKDWLPFWQNFESIVHNDTSCPVTMKFAILRQQLKGQALGIIAGLQPIEQNYAVAIDLLKKHFSYNHVLIQAHNNAFDSVPQCIGHDDLHTLRRIHATATSKYRALQQLGMSNETVGSVLYTTLCRVLPREIIF